MMDSRVFIDGKVAYGSIPTEGKEEVAVRGAGKRTHCLLKVAETLCNGARVWVRLPSFTTPESVLSELHDVRLISSGRKENQYEKGSMAVGISKRRQAFFGEYSFAETVGLWLKSGREPAAALLSPFISTEGFSFTPAEFIDLRERLQLAIRRYERLPEVSRGLEDLNTGFFRHRSLEESQEFITAHLAQYLTTGDELHRDYLLAIHRHARAAAVSRRAEIGEAGQALSGLRNKLDSARALSGRNRRKALQQLAKDLKGYRGKYGADDGPAPEEELNAITAAIDGQKGLLKESQKHLSRELQSAGLALSSLTVNPLHSKAEKLKALEVRLQDLVSSINEAGLYQLPIGGSDAATTPRQLQQLESILDRLRNTRHHLAELPLFYDRRHFWYAQPAHLRRLLAPLLGMPTSEWEHAFTSWYFERCLEREEEPARYRTDVKDLQQQFSAWERRGLAGDFSGTVSTDQLLFLEGNDEWPASTRPEDLLLSLTGLDDLPPAGNCRYLRLARLQETGGRHIALAGKRNPSLFFTQLFLPLSPPAWRSCRVEVAPVSSPKDQCLLQADEGDWLPMAEWKGGFAVKLHLYLPAQLPGWDAEFLLKNWEEMIAAASEIVFFHSWSPNEITQALLSDGFNAGFLCAALLRAAEAAAVEPYDREELVAMGHEVRFRCGLPTPAHHPLAKEFGRMLSQRMPRYFIEHHLPWRDTFLPLLVTAPDGKKTVLLPNGRLPGRADDLSEARRQGELTSAGFRVMGLPADLIWADADAVLDKITAALTRQTTG